MSSGYYKFFILMFHQNIYFSDSRGYYSQEHNRLLLDGIVRNNSILKEHNNSNEVSTRSVLDALKEISRKRIHVSEVKPINFLCRKQHIVEIKTSIL